MTETASAVSRAAPRTPSLAPFLAAALALSLLVGLAVGLPDYLPTNDGPQHVFALHASAHLDDAANGYARGVRSRGAPVTAT